MEHRYPDGMAVSYDEGNAQPEWFGTWTVEDGAYVQDGNTVHPGFRGDGEHCVVDFGNDEIMKLTFDCCDHGFRRDLPTDGAGMEEHRRRRLS